MASRTTTRTILSLGMLALTCCFSAQAQTKTLDGGELGFRADRRDADAANAQRPKQAAFGLATAARAETLKDADDATREGFGHTQSELARNREDWTPTIQNIPTPRRIVL